MRCWWKEPRRDRTERSAYCKNDTVQNVNADERTNEWFIAGSSQNCVTVGDVTACLKPNLIQPAFLKTGAPLVHSTLHLEI